MSCLAWFSRIPVWKTDIMKVYGFLFSGALENFHTFYKKIVFFFSAILYLSSKGVFIERPPSFLCACILTWSLFVFPFANSFRKGLWGEYLTDISWVFFSFSEKLTHQIWFSGFDVFFWIKRIWEAPRYKWLCPIFFYRLNYGPRNSQVLDFFYCFLKLFFLKLTSQTWGCEFNYINV